jgi:NADH-quinone oxidoreductase subunit L
MTFWGEERFPEEAGHHPHKAPPVMAWPLRILAVCALFIGFVVGPTHLFANYLYHMDGLVTVVEPESHVGVMAQSAAIAVVGVGLAWLFYLRSPGLPARVAAAMEPLYQASLNKFYLDDIFWTLLVLPLRALAWVSDWVDRAIIDPLVDALAMIPRRLSAAPLWMHNGRVTTYALVMWAGLLLCVLFAKGLLP